MHKIHSVLFSCQTSKKLLDDMGDHGNNKGQRLKVFACPYELIKLLSNCFGLPNIP